MERIAGQGRRVASDAREVAGRGHGVEFANMRQTSGHERPLSNQRELANQRAWIAGGGRDGRRVGHAPISWLGHSLACSEHDDEVEPARNQSSKFEPAWLKADSGKFSRVPARASGRS